MDWLDEKLQQADYNKLDEIRNEAMKNNERNAGRKKGTNIAHTVRCHPKVIKDVRKYAKEQSEKYLEQLKKQK